MCNNENVIVSFSSVNNPTVGLRFDLDVINDYPAEISGYSSPLSGLQLSDIINEALNNSGDTARMIQYVIRPFTIDPIGSQKCGGIRDTISVWVNPTPRVIPINIADRICYEDFTDIELTTPTVMTHGIIEFGYTVALSNSTFVTGNTDPSPIDLQVGDHIVFDYTNDDDTIQSVFYYVTPKNVITGCANGTIETVEVKLHPIPIRSIVVTNPLTCSGGDDLALLATLSRGTAPFDSIHWIGYYEYQAFDTTFIDGLRPGLYELTVIDNNGCRADSSIFRSKDPPLTEFTPIRKRDPVYSQLFNINTSCFYSNDGEIVVGVTSPEAFPFTYWVTDEAGDTIQTGVLDESYDPGDTDTYDIVPNVGGGQLLTQYFVAFEDDNGCITTNDTYVRSPYQISADLVPYEYQGGFNITCKGYSDGIIHVSNITGGSVLSQNDYTYLWTASDGGVISGDNTLDSISGLPYGTYTVTVFDLFGCSFIDSITLTEPEGITLLSDTVSTYQDGNNISCHGINNGSISLEFEGGSGDYVYEWTGPDSFTSTEKNINSLYAGTYDLLVTDQTGCDMPFSYVLTEPDTLNILFSPTETFDGLYNIDCNGGLADVDITPGGGSLNGYEYLWSTTNGSGFEISDEDQTGLSAATYYVQLTDGNACIYDDSIVITQPEPLQVEVNKTNITCESATMDNGTIDIEVSGGADTHPYIFNWDNGSTTEDLSGLMEGRYIVTIEDAYGCIIIDSADIYLPPPLEIDKIVSDYNGMNIRCLGETNGSIDINVTSGDGPYSFAWEGPDGYTSDQSSINSLPAGQYRVHIVDSNLCELRDTTDMIEPGQIGFDAIISESDFGVYNVNCFNDSTATIELDGINGVGSLSFYWTDGFIGSYREGLGAGQYGVIINDANQCNKDTIINITQPEPISVIETIDEPYCIDMPDGTITLLASGGIVLADYFYVWSDNTTGSVLSNIAAGTYIYTVTDDNGCSLTDTIVVSSERDNCLTIPNAISPNGDGINDVWNIDLIDLYPDAEIKIFNRWGEIVWASEKGYPQPWDGRSKGRELPIDSYHYIINLNNGRKVILGHVTIVR